MLFELNPKDPKSANDQSNAWLEVHNYSAALSKGFDQLKEGSPFCLRLIKDLHKTLLKGVRGQYRSPGEFRDRQVHIGSNRRYVPPPPQEALNCLEDLEVYVNNIDNRFDTLISCFIVHYQIEAIHPFMDGNGRIGRAVLSLMIHKWCNLNMPWLYLSPFFERYKDEYIDNLFRISTEGAWSAWIEFCLRGVIEQSNRAAEMCDNLQKLRRNMHERTEADGKARIHGIIEKLFSFPFVRITDLAKNNKVGYSTAKSDVEYLMKRGILSRIDGIKVKTFFSPEIYNIAYAEN